MRRHPSKAESYTILAIFFLMVLIARCTADDAIDTKAGQIILVSPLGFKALPELSVNAQHLAELRIEQEAVFMPLVDDLEFRNHRIVEGFSVCIFWTGNPRNIPFLCTPTEGEAFKFIVNVGGSSPDPGPDPNPEPELNARAAKVRDIAREVGQPDMAQKISDAYGGVGSQIAAGAITSLPAAKAAIEVAMKQLTLERKWEPLGKAVAKAFNEQAQNLPDAQRLFKDVADGLHVAAKWP